MKPEKEIRLNPASELRLIGEGGKRKLVGYAAVFDSPSEDMGFIETISKGAFAATLSRNPDVRFLINHEGLPLARTVSGTLKLSEDKRGLKFEAVLDDSDPDAQRVIPKIERGDLNQMSFAFRTIRDDWSPDYTRRTLLELDLEDGDCSCVTYPAYKAASVSMRLIEVANASREAWKQSHKRGFNPRLTALKAKSL